MSVTCALSVYPSKASSGFHSLSSIFHCPFPASTGTRAKYLSMVCKLFTATVGCVAFHRNWFKCSGTSSTPVLVQRNKSFDIHCCSIFSSVFSLPVRKHRELLLALALVWLSHCKVYSQSFLCDGQGTIR